MNLFSGLPARAAAHYQRSRRPWVTLAYAQSLDGSIAIQRAEQLNLSGDESRLMTHQLRAMHDAILVGIGTVLADDPRLTARLVDGRNPQPVILDTRLRFPLTARLLQNPDLGPLLIASNLASETSRLALEAAGARVLGVPTLENGLLDLNAILDQLGGLGITSVMVEGGARTITSFLKNALVDTLILTIAPTLVGGLNAIDPALWLGMSPLPRLRDVHCQQLGEDVIIWGDLSAEQA